MIIAHVTGFHASIVSPTSAKCEVLRAVTMAPTSMRVYKTGVHFRRVSRPQYAPREPTCARGLSESRKSR